MIKIPIEISTRHIHLSQKDLETLFGKGYELKKMRDLSQPGEFAAEEIVDIKANSKLLKKVRVIGPVREKTQVELSHTELIFLKIKPVVRESGDLEGTPGALLMGPKGEVELRKGIINTWRHIHCNPEEAGKLGLEDKMSVSVKTRGKCSVIFHNVKAHISENSPLSMHLDTDEGNAACIPEKGEGYLVKI